MYLAEIQQALIDTALRRVRAGELTERGLARLCGVSQPHLHNVLKRIRALSTASADRLMRALNLSTEDLLWAAMSNGGTQVRAVPLARNRIGPGYGTDLTATRGAMCFRGRRTGEYFGAPHLHPRGWRGGVPRRGRSADRGGCAPRARPGDEQVSGSERSGAAGSEPGGADRASGERALDSGVGRKPFGTLSSEGQYLSVRRQ